MKNPASTEKPIEEQIDDRLKEVSLQAIETLENDLTNSDWKARQAAANSVLVKAGHSGEKEKEVGNIVNINLGRITDGLREVDAMGFGGTNGSTQRQVHALTKRSTD